MNNYEKLYFYYNFIHSNIKLINFSRINNRWRKSKARNRFIFEGAIKDIVYPENYNLAEELTDIHIEARVNWDIQNIPEGTPAGGFIPYLKINAVVTNKRTDLKTYVDLIPHINLVDNFHYARNISLPGNIDDKYEVEFFINNPSKFDLSFHKDWLDNYSELLIEDKVFKYSDISFGEIARLSRR